MKTKKKVRKTKVRKTIYRSIHGTPVVYNPEITKAREVNEPEPGIGIEACVEIYGASLRRRSLSQSHIHNCLVPFQRRKPVEYTNGRAKNMSLLDYLDRQNVTVREPVLRMEQLTSDILDEWS